MPRGKQGTGYRPIRSGDKFETLGETGLGPAGVRGTIIGPKRDDSGNVVEGKFEVRAERMGVRTVVSRETIRLI